MSASGGGGRNPPLLRSLAPPTFFSDPKNEKAKILQSDLNFGLSMTTAPFIYRRYHFLKSPQLRCNINVFCIISRDCLFCFDGGPSQTFTNSCNGVPVLNEFLCILASLECARISNWEACKMTRERRHTGILANFPGVRPPRPPCKGLYPNISTSRHFVAWVCCVLQTAACAPYSSQIPSYSESCGQP